MASVDFPRGGYRYIPGVFQIINVDAVSKPDELLPTGLQAHQS